MCRRVQTILPCWKCGCILFFFRIAWTVNVKRGCSLVAQVACSNASNSNTMQMEMEINCAYHGTAVYRRKGIELLQHVVVLYCCLIKNMWCIMFLPCSDEYALYAVCSNSLSCKLRSYVNKHNILWVYILRKRLIMIN